MCCKCVYVWMWAVIRSILYCCTITSNLPRILDQAHCVIDYIKLFNKVHWPSVTEYGSRLRALRELPLLPPTVVKRTQLNAFPFSVPNTTTKYYGYFTRVFIETFASFHVLEALTSSSNTYFSNICTFQYDYNYHTFDEIVGGIAEQSNLKIMNSV